MLKSTGITRKLDRLGRVVIPIETRRILCLEEQDPVEIFFDKEAGAIMLKPYRPGCLFCGTAQELVHFRQFWVCRSCIELARETEKRGKVILEDAL